jgi:serine/threonine-protein kinase
MHKNRIMGSLDVTSDRADPLIGAMLGKDYRVIEPIGFGGMAVVYLVEHQTLRKQFAAKVLSVALTASEEARARFSQEAHAASQLDHENIVGISDFGETVDQRPFFVMELLRGQTLDQRLAEGAMSLEEVVAVAVPVSRALAHAHAEGIIHRDIKPENVFLVQRSQGRFGIKVVDFGIAKTPVNTRLTRMGETLGSPMFMSPEACRGDDVDPRADLYSFGVLLYLMLCGRVPFEHENLLKVLQMQVTEPLPPPRSVNPEVSSEMAAVVERALAKDPADRFASMDALLVDLEAAVPAGADRLLIEARSGGASSFRFAGCTSTPRLIDSQGSPSQPQAAYRSQPMPGYRSPQLAGATSATTLQALPPRRRRNRAWLAVPAIAVVMVVSWLAVSRGGERVPAAPTPPPSGSTARGSGGAEAQAPAVAAPLEPAAAPAVAAPLEPATTPSGAAAVSADPDGPATTTAHPPEPEPEPEVVPVQPATAPPPRSPRIVKRPATPREPRRAGSAAANSDPNLDIRLRR